MIKQSFPRSPDRIAAVIAGACLAVGVVGTNFIAFSQDQSVASPQEVMFARKTLMSAIANNMQEIEGMTSSGARVPPLYPLLARARGPRRGVSRQRRTGRFATDSVLRRAARGDGANDGARAIGRTPSALVGPRSLERSAAPAALERSAASNGVIDNRSPHPKTVTLPRVNQLCLAYARARGARGDIERCQPTDPLAPPVRRCD
jgi:hypothetical protein